MFDRTWSEVVMKKRRGPGSTLLPGPRRPSDPLPRSARRYGFGVSGALARPLGNVTRCIGLGLVSGRRIARGPDRRLGDRVAERLGHRPAGRRFERHTPPP